MKVMLIEYLYQIDVIYCKINVLKMSYIKRLRPYYNFLKLLIHAKDIIYIYIMGYFFNGWL